MLLPEGLSTAWTALMHFQGHDGIVKLHAPYTEFYSKE